MGVFFLILFYFLIISLVVEITRYRQVNTASTLQMRQSDYGSFRTHSVFVIYKYCKDHCDKSTTVSIHDL